MFSIISVPVPSIIFVDLASYVQQNENNLTCLHSGKITAQKSRETHGLFSLYTLINVTNQEKLWPVSRKDAFTYSDGCEVDRLFAYSLSMLP